MKKHNLMATFLVSMLIISACGGQGTPAENATVAPSSTATVAPATATKTITPTTETPATETPAPTATLVVPTNAPNCVNSASFVADVTVEDNSPVTAGSIFTKTWRIKNTGTCVWQAGYTLEYYSAETLGVIDPVQLSLTAPGQTLDITVEMKAPVSPGTYRGNFVIKNPAGLIMKIDNDSRLWVIINVPQVASASTPVVPVTGASETPVPGVPTSAATAGAATAMPGGTASAGTATPTSLACALTFDQTRVSGVLAAINAYRAQNGIVPYTTDPLLVQAAQRHANDIACHKLFVHKGSDGSTPPTRVAETGYVAVAVTENVYGSYPPLTPQGAVNWWAADQTEPRHNLNLLSTQYTQIGVGYAALNNFGFYVVVFAQP